MTPREIIANVRVKPLEWRDKSGSEYEVRWDGVGIGAHYVAKAVKCGDLILCCGKYHSDINKAKAAAQADYERRIRSTLSDAVADREAEPVASVAEVRADGQRLYNTVYPSDALDKFPIGTLLYTTPPTPELEALRKRVAELEKAMEPFAKAAKAYDGVTNNGAVWGDDGITIAHLRIARRVREGGKVE